MSHNILQGFIHKVSFRAKRKTFKILVIYFNSTRFLSNSALRLIFKLIILFALKSPIWNIFGTSWSVICGQKIHMWMGMSWGVIRGQTIRSKSLLLITVINVDFLSTNDASRYSRFVSQIGHILLARWIWKLVKNGLEITSINFQNRSK